MNASTQTTPAAAPAITEADVVAFLAIKLAELRHKTGVSYAFVSVEVGGGNSDATPAWGTYVDGGTYLSGKTADEVVEKAADEVGPGKVAARKRAEAERLLAEAEKLEAATAQKEAA